MAAQFPGQVRTWTPKVDLVNTVYADHINLLQDEVRAVESTLTSDILTSDYTGAFALTSSWTNLSLRLRNIEAGLVNGVTGSVYFKKTGDTVTPPSGTVGISLKTTAGTSNLVETRSAANVLNFNVDKDGLPKVGAAVVVYVGSPEYTALVSATTAAQSQADAAPFNQFLLAGL